MNKDGIVRALDSEIERLRQARSLLGGGELRGVRARRGRPPGGRKGTRRMSAEARARISAAQKKRWAAVKAAKKK